MVRQNISVVIPVYNREDFLEGCINSVLDQKDPGCTYEVIVVDDGSTDGSSEVLKKFGNKIRYKRIENSGRPAVPRNVGIKMAKGEYIAFQDSDDLWKPNKLMLQYKSLVNSNNILSYGNADVIDEFGKPLNRQVINSKQAREGMVFDDLIKDNFISNLTVMTYKNAILDAGGFDEAPELRAVEDYELWLRLSLKGSFGFVNKSLANYRHHSQNISSESAYVSTKKLMKVMKSLEQQDLTNTQRDALCNRQREITSQLASLSSFPKSLIWKLRERMV